VKYGGYAGMLTSLLALYMTAKSMINEAWGKIVLP
jgi:succinate-acetate transporter protein